VRQTNRPAKSSKGNRQENSGRRAANDVTAGFGFRFQMFVLGFTMFSGIWGAKFGKISQLY
jgi:hypothetical protein